MEKFLAVSNGFIFLVQHELIKSELKSSSRSHIFVDTL